SPGKAVYEEAEYDIAYSHWLLGRVLRDGGDANAALAPLGEAQRRFESLANFGSDSAARMTSVAIAEGATCLRELGRLDEATAAYQDASRRAGQLGDQRAVAVIEGQ